MQDVLHAGRHAQCLFLKIRTRARTLQPPRLERTDLAPAPRGVAHHGGRVLTIPCSRGLSWRGPHPSTLGGRVPGGRTPVRRPQPAQPNGGCDGRRGGWPGVGGCGGTRGRLPCHRVAVAAPRPGSVVDVHWRRPARDQHARPPRTPPRRPPDPRGDCCRRPPRRRRVHRVDALRRHAAARPAARGTPASSGARPCATRRRGTLSPPGVGRMAGALGRRAARVGAWRGRRGVITSVARWWRWWSRVGGARSPDVTRWHDTTWAEGSVGLSRRALHDKKPHHFDECVLSNVRQCFGPHEAGRPPATAADAAEI